MRQSCCYGLDIGAHNAVHPVEFGKVVEFLECELLQTPALLKGFNRQVISHLRAQPKAIGDSLCG